MPTSVCWLLGYALVTTEACCISEFLRSQNISSTLSIPHRGMKKQRSILEQLRVALSHVPLHLRSGLHLEFGVRRGDSIRFLANLTGEQAHWHGFDSFEGLPEDGFGTWKRGTFTLHGKMPDVPANVHLHKGWFNETLPSFLDSELSKAASGTRAVAFANMDADLYSSTISVLDAIMSRCMHRAGTVFSFDEIAGTRHAANHEWRALQEAQKRYKFTFHFISYLVTASPFLRAAVQLDSCGARCADNCYEGGRVPTTTR